MARVTMMPTVHMNEKLSVFLKEYNNFPLICLKQLWTYLFMHRTRYLSRAMVIMVKALQLKATLSKNKIIDSRTLCSWIAMKEIALEIKVKNVVKSNTARKIIRQLNLIFVSFCFKVRMKAMLLTIPTKA